MHLEVLKVAAIALNDLPRTGNDRISLYHPALQKQGLECGNPDSSGPLYLRFGGLAWSSDSHHPSFRTSTRQFDVLGSLSLTVEGQFCTRTPRPQPGFCDVKCFWHVSVTSDQLR